MSYNCGCNCGCNYNDCGCQTSPCSSCTPIPTTTTTTIPCIGTTCDSILDTDCVLNNNNGLVCYGINYGESLNRVVGNLITAFTNVECSTTTTTSTTTTSTSTTSTTSTSTTSTSTTSTSTTSTTTSTTSTTTTTTAAPTAAQCVTNNGWSTANLAVTQYRDSTALVFVDPGATYNAQWMSMQVGAYTCPGGDCSSGNIALYGYLYNWYAVAGIYDAASLANPLLRKTLAPAGKHIPTLTEWQNLVSCLNSPDNAGAIIKEMGTTYWNNALGTNTSGFNARGAGFRNELTGSTQDFKVYANWWTSTLDNNGNAYSPSVYTAVTQIGQVNNPKGLARGCSVRVING